MINGVDCGQPQVLSAHVNLTSETATVSLVPEQKTAPDGLKQLGEELAQHLTTCGFTSTLRGMVFFFFFCVVSIFLFLCFPWSLWHHKIILQHPFTFSHNPLQFLLYLPCGFVTMISSLVKIQVDRIHNIFGLRRNLLLSSFIIIFFFYFFIGGNSISFELSSLIYFNKIT